jgi:hypothetical protein
VSLSRARGPRPVPVSRLGGPESGAAWGKSGGLARVENDLGPAVFTGVEVLVSLRRLIQGRSWDTIQEGLTLSAATRLRK